MVVRIRLKLQVQENTEETVQQAQQSFKAESGLFNVHPSLLSLSATSFIFTHLRGFLHAWRSRIITTQGKQCVKGWIFTIR